MKERAGNSNTKTPIFAVMVIIAVALSIASGCAKKKSDVNYITGHDYLYDVAIDYLREEYMKDEESEKEYWEAELEDYQVFFDYKGYGISQENNKKFAYMLILNEAFYVVNGEFQQGSGSSMPYRFEFENDKVVNYEVPMDGTLYASSIKEIFPDDIADEIFNFNYYGNELSVDDKVKEYYSYLDSSD